ncbi:MAG: hypothetical protein COV99_11750 [Bacteroidetes bacterium CG12_big_fil_rev_8_21_14_0_65_60_17]|nr:MAG: hypothetical protein COV99_11750 [Bacteroidetes bacterium CG12_big_fil_rev_8_21_14_0_65_60_17]
MPMRLGRAATRLDGQRERLAHRSSLFSRVRLGLVLAGVLTAAVAFSAQQSGLAWVVVGGTTVIFAIVVRYHERVAERIRSHDIAIRLRREELARITCRWEDLPSPVDVAGPLGVSESHAFAADLNLFGPRSVHHLFDTALSRDGSRELGRWLLDEGEGVADGTGRATERQRLVRELRDMPVFRYRLAVAAGLVRIHENHPFDGQILLDWLGRRQVSPGVRLLLGVLTGLAALNAALVTTHALGWTPALWLFSFTAYAAIYLLNSRHYEHLFDDAEHLYYQLRHLRPVLRVLERFRFHGRPALEALCRPLQDGSPSRELARLSRLAAAASTQKSEVLRLVLNILVPWDLLFSVRLARAGERLHRELPAWLHAWRTLEAAGSLAAWAWRHPEAVFPAFRGDTAASASREDDPDTTLLEADALGHPLIPPEERVSNDFALGGAGHVVLITGSNMSGKSTFLRTVGVNVVLARAGSAVAASRMMLRPCRLFTSINVSDSLGDGMSYFYAEVKRLRALLDALSQDSGPPLLFLVDEIFRGTNNRERYAGSRAILEALRRGRGAGLVTTHDLELIHLEGLDNRHFREHIEHGRMAFDYLLHNGPCPTTNALAIMKMEGLPV